MDWRVALTSFLTLVLAELGDKTQLLAMSLAASSKKPWMVFLGGSAALMLLTGLAAFFGEAITRAVPEAILRRVSAGMFVCMGVWLWFKK
jgi:putative Ca2+/H+ antiporter (TMEM165/GDT1 family)